ncbi:MAG: hypothetical protein V2J24_02015 [Pseudomonadales bacterium]|nr:hypothetical protein [Pseudomonadales bacterium]
MSAIRRGMTAALLGSALLGAGASADRGPLRDGRIGFVMTNMFWSVYQTPGAEEECPDGYNIGPRGEFAALFPEHEGMTVEETRLAQETLTWLPSPEPGRFEHKYVEGRHGYGLDLDGEVGPEDFVHPETGQQGIDNEVYRAVGCIIGFRGPDGVEVIFQDKAILTDRYNRMMIELTGVDDLDDDDEVTVSWYRGRDRLLTDATGQKVMPGGTQRVDRRWGESLIRRTTGRIEDGVLTTEPLDDLVVPWQNLSVPSIHTIRGARLQLSLREDGAEGILAGYADVDDYYFQLIRNDSTHHLANGQISGIALYKALSRLADGYPDPETGRNTAISTSIDVKMAQVFVVDETPTAAVAQAE